MTSAILRMAAAILMGAAASSAAAQPGVTAEGTEFVMRTPEGQVLRSADLVGATLTLRTEEGETEVTIQSAEEDGRANGGRVWLHRFTVPGADGRPYDLCKPDAQGLSAGFPLPEEHGGLVITCTSGAIGKCVRWGYRFWEEHEGGPPLRALHRACVHLARADYGGDGRPATRPGVTIHVCDRFDIRPCREDAPLAFEAAWGPEGAICIAHPRVAELITLHELAMRVPRLRDRIGPEACSEATARTDRSALLLSRSANTRARGQSPALSWSVGRPAGINRPLKKALPSGVPYHFRRKER